MCLLLTISKTISAHGLRHDPYADVASKSFLNWNTESMLKLNSTKSFIHVAQRNTIRFFFF